VTKVFPGARIVIDKLKLFIATRGEYAIVSCSSRGDLLTYNVS
jgi:hypothetical protein